MGEHIIIVTASSIVDVGRGTGSINYFSSTFLSIFQPLSNKIGRGKNLACLIALDRVEKKLAKTCVMLERRRYSRLENTFLFRNFVEVNLLICQNE